MSNEVSANITIAGLLRGLTPKQAWALLTAVVVVLSGFFGAGIKLEQYREAHRSVQFATEESRAEFLARYSRFLISRDMDQERSQRCVAEVSAETQRAAEILAELISIWWVNQGHSTANPSYNPGSPSVKKGFDPVNDAHVVFPTGESWPIPGLVKTMVHQAPH
jgi:hypothetical protein